MVMSERIRPYSVMVKWNNDVVGSGILVKSKDNKCYLFTARHLFKKGSGENFKNVKESYVRKELDENKITINSNRENFKNSIFADKILYFRDDLDLIVFSLKEEPPIEHLPIIKILKNDHQTQKYHFYGYPKGAKNLEGKHTGNPEYAQYVQSNEEENHVFRLSATKNIGGDAVSGYSGSGIFVESKEKIKVDNNELIENSVIYLVGILIRAKEGLSYYEGVDLSKVIDDINDKANIEIPTIEDAIDIKLTSSIKTKILNRNSEDNFIQQIERLNKNGNKILLKEFLDNSENELAEMTRKLADFYLLGGMRYKDNGYEESARKYFRLATKFNPRYRIYEKKDKVENVEIEKISEEQSEESINYYHDGIISFQDEKKYSEAKQSFINHLKTENIDSFEKVETHKYLSKIYFVEENYIDAETHAFEALDGYGENNILEKAELYYELFKICHASEEECSSLGWVKKALKYIRENKIEDKEDENLLVIERKLENEEKLLEKDDYINKMSPTLVELVRLYPEEYIDEFLTEYTKSQKHTSIYSRFKDYVLKKIKSIKEEKRFIPQKKHLMLEKSKD